MSGRIPVAHPLGKSSQRLSSLPLSQPSRICVGGFDDDAVGGVMRGIVGIASVVILASAVGTANAVEPYVLNLSGNNFSISEATAIGQQLNLVAMLSQVQSTSPIPLPGITTWSTEYTVSVSGLTLASPPGNQVKSYTGGVIELWSETPGDAPWTPTTPVSSIPAFNGGQVPTTFSDGELLLGGVFTQFATLFFGGQTGTITSTIDWTSGSRLADLQALGIASDWHWNGFFNVTAPVPPGYFLLYGGKLEHEVPVAVEASTWGAIKNTMRAE
jgi:hypothetical protein